MQELFERIKKAYDSLWRVRVLGESLEIVTPMVTANDFFVTVFVTRRGGEYIVTDGGWISSGNYDCEIDFSQKTYQKLFYFYLENYSILQTVGHGRNIYYKKVADPLLVVNAVFDLSNFISAVISGSNIQFAADKKEKQFNTTVKEYLCSEFEPGLFDFRKRVIPNSFLEFGAVSKFSGHLQLINVVTGSNPSYFRDSLCRSNFYFEAAKRIEYLRINKTVAILDDTNPRVYQSPFVRETISLSGAEKGIILLPWSDRGGLRNILEAV